MKTLFFIPAMFLNFLLLAQLTEHFHDGNLTENPTWSGDIAYFYVNDANELQSRGQSLSSSICVSTSSNKIRSASWEFLVKLPFASSTSNYAKVYLCSDTINTKGSVHGYFIKIGGESGNADGIHFYRQDGFSSTKLIDGIDGHVGKNNNIVRIRMSCDDQGLWQLYSDTTGGFHFMPEGQAIDSTYSSSDYFSIVYVHSSTRRNQFYFDDLLIKNAPLKIARVLPLSASSIRVFFNKIIKNDSMRSSHFYLTHLGKPDTIAGEGNYIDLYYNSRIPNGQYALSIAGLMDTEYEDYLTQTFSFYFQKPLSYGSLIITEIYPDPTPSNGLPLEEFIELYNSTSDTINLKGCTLSDATSTSSIPDIHIPPMSYLIVTSYDGANSYQKYGTTLGIYTWPSLNNDGDLVRIKTPDGNLIYEVSYTAQMHKDTDKREGGWSLEMINVLELCKGNFNWTSSTAVLGGTPGTDNSCTTRSIDDTAPFIVYTYPVDSLGLDLHFNEPIDTLSIHSGFITCDESIVVTASSATIISIKLRDETIENKEVLLTIGGIKDCMGNTANDTLLRWIIPGRADSMDIVLNELLFNPMPGGVDFVELINRSDKYIDLSGWKIQSIKEDGKVDEKILSTNSCIINPYGILAFTSSIPLLERDHWVPFSEQVMEIPIPSFNDDQGTVTVLNKNNKPMDSFRYSESFHSPLLKDREGVSLERLSVWQPTNSMHNWYSASGNSGYATPGFENSQHQKQQGNDNSQFHIDPVVFTPNGDNFHDLCFLYYHFSEPGNSCTIRIFNSEGRLIKKLAQNELTGQSGFFLWDGSNDNGALVENGIYILLIERINSDGSQSSHKKSIVVASDF